MFTMTNEMDLAAERYCRDNLNLLVAIERDSELREWFCDFPVTGRSGRHAGLCDELHDQIKKRAFVDGIAFPEYENVLRTAGITTEDIKYLSCLELAEMTKEELLACISHMLNDYTDSRLYQYAIGDGQLLSFMEAYLDLCEEPGYVKA